MGRGVQTIDRAMIRCVVQVGLDCYFLATLIPVVVATMTAIEILEDGTPCLGIALLIGKTPDRARNHSVNDSLVVVGVFPPGTCPIPRHSRRVMRPGDSAGDHAAGNTHWRKRGFKKRRTQRSGSCNRQGELPASHSHFNSSPKGLR